jgi:uncharacterized membrane protein
MNEKQYVAALRKGLKSIDAEDREVVLGDYREHFRLGREAGKGDAEIASSLGDPGEAAAGAVAELVGEEGNREKTAGKAVRITVAGVSLLFFNAVFVVGPYAGLVGALVGLWAGAISLVVSGVAAILAVPAEPIVRLFVEYVTLPGAGIRIAVVLAGIATLSLGALACIGMTYVSRWFGIGTARYIALNKRILVK